MPEFYIKINKYQAFLTQYRLTGPNVFKIDLTYDFYEATPFEEDDYIFELVKIWFKNDCEKIPVDVEILSLNLTTDEKNIYDFL